MHNGNLAIERGLHQEIGWERQTDDSGMSVVVYSDNMQNPVIEAAGHFAAGKGAPASNNMLFDRTSGLLRVSGPDLPPPA